VDARSSNHFLVAWAKKYREEQRVSDATNSNENLLSSNVEFDYHSFGPLPPDDEDTPDEWIDLFPKKQL
jgi:hypothetical protein